MTFDAQTREQQVLRRSTELELDARYISRAEPIEFEGADGLPSYGFYYAPTNPECDGPPGELPPLVVSVHGGPTAHVSTALDLSAQFFTSRGIALVDLNYEGSTGYGRAYQDRLRGRWGDVDVEDSAAAVRYLVERGDVDSGRDEVSHRGSAVLDVHVAPPASQPVLVRTAVARASFVVEVDERDAAAGEELCGEIEGGRHVGRWTTGDRHHERRQLARRSV